MLKVNKIKDFSMLIMSAIVCSLGAWMFLHYTGQKTIHVFIMSYAVAMCIDIISGKNDTSGILGNKRLMKLSCTLGCSLVILIFVTVAIIMHEPKNGLDTTIAIAFLFLAGMVYFSSAGLMGHLAGEFQIRNFKAERSESPVLFNFIIVLCYGFSTVCFIGFAKLVFDLISMV